MIQGEIFTFPLPELFQWLTVTQSSGSLVIAQGGDGKQMYAVANGPLLDTPSAKASQRNSLEFYLVMGDIVAASSSGRAPVMQPDAVRDALVTALQWPTGRFTFSQAPLPAWALSTHLRLPSEKLLTEAETKLRQGQPPSALPKERCLEPALDHSDSFTLTECLRLYVVNRILQADFKLPALPDLAARVLELIKDEEFSLRSLSELVTKDPTVAAQVLRYANSAINSATREIESLDQAVQRLGADEVVNIVLAATMQAMRLPNDQFAAEKHQLWQHSAAAAFIARTIALRVGLKGSLAFMCALLMDLGAAVLYTLLQSMVERRTALQSIPREIVEEIVREHHPRIGRVIGEQWQLPLSVIETMTHHHNREENYHQQPYVALASLGDYLAGIGLSTPTGNLKEALAHFPPALLSTHPAAQLVQLNTSKAITVLTALPRDLRQSRELLVA